MFTYFIFLLLFFFLHTYCKHIVTLYCLLFVLSVSSLLQDMGHNDHNFTLQSELTIMETTLSHIVCVSLIFLSLYMFTWYRKYNQKQLINVLAYTNIYIYIDLSTCILTMCLILAFAKIYLIFPNHRKK